uniref:Uncharacterized protein n=1 Tax=Kalanchoe fedtschenkoi TaxID=63787 RepID=A0A7N0RD00_KALFE
MCPETLTLPQSLQPHIPTTFLFTTYLQQNSQRLLMKKLKKYSFNQLFHIDEDVLLKPK